jgi:S1-C subfamily serine protease
MARRDDMPKWVPAGSIEGLFLDSSSAQESRSTAALGKWAARIVTWLATAWGAVRLAFWLSWQKVKLLFLHQRAKMLGKQQTALFRSAGVRLVADAAGAAEGDAQFAQCRQLCQARQLALDAAKAGDAVKRIEAKRLEEELSTAYVEIGRRGLESERPFEVGDELRSRLMQTQGCIALNQKRLDQARQHWDGVQPRTRRLALAGCVASLCLLLCAVVFAWPGSTTDAEPPPASPPEQTVSAPSPKPPDPPKPRRRDLKELFAALAPSVPIVEAVGSGTGTGFLLEQDGKFIVVTNRHVIDNARQGVAIHFLIGRGAKAEPPFTVPKEQTRVVGIHREADLAVLDVSAAAKGIRQRKIESLQLAPVGHQPQVGEDVFAIGHPGDGRGGLLPGTLSGPGIVSAVGRSRDDGRFLQVTVPMNPGNSGGPLFDYEGRVVGVNTFVIRKNERRDIALEALNFALESDFVHELVKNPARKSLDAKSIALLLNPPVPPRPESLKTELAAKTKPFERKGYRPVAALSRTFRLGAGQQYVLTTRCGRAGEGAVVAVSRGAEDIDLAVVTRAGEVLASDTRVNTDPEVTFRTDGPAELAIVVVNPSGTEAVVALSLLEK